MTEPERVRTGVVSVVGGAALVVCAGLVALAGWLVVPARDHRPARQPSPLEHGLFDRAHGGEAAHALPIDRAIDRAIDAVVADPSLIGLSP